MNKFVKIFKDPIYYFILIIGRLLPDTLECDKFYVKLLYKHKLRKKCNIDNPITFNEKLQWLKLYDRNPLYTKMVDKYEAKNYVSSLIGEKYIIPTLGVYNNFDDIDFEKLPSQFVLKCTHDSGGLVICNDKSKLDINDARKKMNHFLKRNYYVNTREWPYKNVKPRIIAEKYLKDDDKIVPEDYKIYCINGKPKYIVVFHNRFNKSKQLSETVYDVNWIPQHISLDDHFAVSDIVIPKPKCLDELLEICRKLCKGFPQIRIDFYIIKNKIYFGELTLTTAGGVGRMIPEKLDYILGQEIDLHEISTKIGNTN